MGAQIAEWPAAGFSDTSLSYATLVSKSFGLKIAQRRLATPWVVEALDVIEPDRTGDDLSWETVTFITDGKLDHATSSSPEILTPRLCDNTDPHEVARLSVRRGADQRKKVRLLGTILDRSQMHLFKLVQQLLRIDESRRTEALGEPGVDRREQIVGFLPLPAVDPHAGKRGRRAQIEGCAVLFPSYLDGAEIVCFASLDIGAAERSKRSPAMR